MPVGIAAICVSLKIIHFLEHFRALLKNWAGSTEFPYKSLPNNFPCYSHLGLVWYICYSWWADINTLLLSDSVEYNTASYLYCTVLRVLSNTQCRVSTAVLLYRAVLLSEVPVLHLFISACPQVPGNHRSMHLCRSPFSRMACSWTYTTRSLFS